MEYRIVETVASNLLGLALAKNHPMYSEISAMIMQYHINGTLLDIINRYKRERSCPGASPGVANLPPRMGLKPMKGLLMVTGVVGFLATGLIIYERIRNIVVAEKGNGPEGLKETEAEIKDIR